MSNNADALARKWRNKWWGEDLFDEFKRDIAVFERAAADLPVDLVREIENVNRLTAENQRLRGAAERMRQDFLDCARYDATMEGPKFMAWNRSALDRLRVRYEAALPLDPEPTT